MYKFECIFIISLIIINKCCHTQKSSTKCEEYKEELCPNSIPFIVGGNSTMGKELPFMALVGFGDESNIDWRCGGSLISPRYVLSAGHCNDGTDPSWIRLGELDRSSYLDDALPQQFRIAEIYNHPNYRKPYKYYDISLYRLDEDAVLNEYVRPICLSQSPTYEAGEKVVAAGWGYTQYYEEDGPVSPNLQQIDLEIFDVRGCNRNEYQVSAPDGLSKSSMLCAGSQEDGKDACTGDSGGPLFLQPSEEQLRTHCFLYVQIGITSFGYKCGEKDFPGIYTNVNYFLRWIESIVWP